MRTIVILTVIGTTTAALAYNFMREDSVVEQLQAKAPPTATTSDLQLQERLDELASALARHEQTSQERLQEAQSQNTRLNRTLADLDTRLRSVEAGARGQTTSTVGSDSDEQATDESNSEGGKARSRKVTEADLGHWMDETLRVGTFDQVATQLAIEQAGKSVAEAPGVILEDMQCGERFCRATFADQNGERPAIERLFGAPPFSTEGFTINETDGRVSLYFTRPGETIEGFRREARAAVPG